MVLGECSSLLNDIGIVSDNGMTDHKINTIRPVRARLQSVCNLRMSYPPRKPHLVL